MKQSATALVSAGWTCRGATRAIGSYQLNHAHTGAPMTQTPAYQVTDPATGKIAETFPFAADAEIEQALAAATAAFTQWRERPVAERAAIVRRVAELFT